MTSTLITINAAAAGVVRQALERQGKWEQLGHLLSRVDDATYTCAVNKSFLESLDPGNISEAIIAADANFLHRAAFISD